MEEYLLPFSTPYPEKITPADIKNLVDTHQTPFYFYDEATLHRQASRIKSIDRLVTIYQKNDLKFTPRFAVKANSNQTILKQFNAWGIEFDASSIYEVERLVKVGINPQKIMLTAQELFQINEIENYLSFIDQISWNASSLHQLSLIGELMNYYPEKFSIDKRKVSVRINPGKGTGIIGKTNVAGAESGFGIWYEYIDEIKKIAEKYQLTIGKIHTHIGSGGDPVVWSEVAKISLNLLNDFPEANTINLGGGFKVARHQDDHSTSIEVVGEVIEKAMTEFNQRTGREVNLELEPGTFFVAEAGLLVAKIIDIVSTGEKGFNFIKLDAGMNDLIRPSLYESKHQIELLQKHTGKATKKYRVIGHCCESSDQFTAGSEEIVLPEAEIGDLVVIHGAGAYGASMSSHYNSFPISAEFLKRENGEIKMIRRRGVIEDSFKNEV